MIILLMFSHIRFTFYSEVRIYLTKLFITIPSNTNSCLILGYSRDDWQFEAVKMVSYGISATY